MTRRSSTTARVLALALGAASITCASRGGPAATTADSGARYPRRAPGCQLAVYYTPVPGVPAWDDLGVAEAVCHISDPQAECLRVLRAEACRMGGDVIYNVPRRPYRPRDQVVQYRAQVAHTRGTAASIKVEDPDLPPAASPEESSGPVVPLPSADAPAPAPVPAPDGAPAPALPKIPGPAPGPPRSAP